MYVHMVQIHIHVHIYTECLCTQCTCMHTYYYIYTRTHTCTYTYTCTQYTRMRIYGIVHANVYNLTNVVFEYSNKTCELSLSTRDSLTHCSTAVSRSKHCMLVREVDPRKQVLNTRKQPLPCTKLCCLCCQIVRMWHLCKST